MTSSVESRFAPRSRKTFSMTNCPRLSRRQIEHAYVPSLIGVTRIASCGVRAEVENDTRHLPFVSHPHLQLMNRAVGPCFLSELFGKFSNAPTRSFVLGIEFQNLLCGQ